MAGSQKQVMRIFTRGLKIPTLVGKLSGGWRIPGGPYTVSQFVGGGGVLVAGMVAGDLVLPWGYFTNRAAVLVAAVATVFALKFVKVGGRDPVSAAWALGRVLGAPAAGRVAGGTPVLPRPQRVRRSRSRWVLEDLGAVPVTPPAAAPSGTAVVQDATPAADNADQVRQEPAAVGVAAGPPVVDGRPVRRALTGVELLLAGVGTSTGQLAQARAGTPREPVVAASTRKS